MAHTSADQSLPNPPAAPPKKGRGRRDVPATLDGAGFAPSMPTNGADLIAQWQLPTAAWREGRLKVNRKVYASNLSELVDECTVEDYDMRGIARDFGPGDYFLLLSGHPGKAWGQHNCKVTISAEYARNQGYQALPERAAPPRLADAAAYRSTADALARPEPIDSSNLALLVESVVERTVRALPKHGPAIPGGGMGFAEAMSFYQTMDRMREAAEDRASARMQELMGREPAEPEKPAGGSFSELLMQALPGLLQAFTPRATLPPPPGSSQPQQPAILQDEPTEDPPMQPVPLSPEEARQFGMAVGMLRPFVPRILTMLDATEDDQEIAAELARFVPAILKAELVALARLAQDRGPGVLGLIAPALQTPRGQAILIRMAALLP